MRKTFLSFTFLLLSIIPTWGQRKGHPVIIPGKGNIDVEQFIKGIDTNMDISNLSLAELRIVRNGFAALQGHIFMDAPLREIFSQTSWYDSLMWARFEKTEATKGYGYSDAPNDYSFKPLPLSFTKDEQAFIARIQQREKELRKTQYHPREGYLVDADKMLNTFQLSSFDPRLKDKLGRNGFAIVPGNKIQLFHVYEKNDYSDFPSFVTTDLYLQLFHFYFDAVVRDIEEKTLDSLVQVLCQTMYNEVSARAKTTDDKRWREANEYCQAYFAIANALVTGQEPLPVAPAYTQVVQDELRKIYASQDDFSDFLDYRDVKYGYSLFRPRGHYTRNERIQRYFRAMMWLQNVPFGTDKPQQMACAVALADAVNCNEKVRKAYDDVFNPMTFIFGKPDNVTIQQVYEETQNTGTSMEKLLKSKHAMRQLCQHIEQISEQQTRIRPKFEVTSRYKVNFMPQRYMPDAEVLNEMIDAENDPTKRSVPCALDVFAAMGNTLAEKILLGDLHAAEQWEGFLPTLANMKQRMGEINWDETVATRWLNSLMVMAGDDANFPYFMQTEQWGKKNLNTALASYAELKHDAILYAKQPAGAECGGYGPPEPILKGYVEPNVAFWNRAIALCQTLKDVLQRHHLMTEKAATGTDALIEQAQFLLQVSEKELRHTPLTDTEYNQIEIIGSTFEYISLQLARSDEQFLDGWDNVHGADREVSIVADVYTANAPNNPNKSILYEATGPAYEIYVIVDIDGNLILTRGAVLSYREFTRPLGEQRMTDEEWQQYRRQHPSYGIPSWMDEITVPLEKEPEDNEELFYSSGC